MSRLYAIKVVCVDFPAPQSERQVAEADGIEPDAKMPVEHEWAAAPVGLRVKQVAVDGKAVQHSVVVQAADYDGIAGVGQWRRIGQSGGARILCVREKCPLPAGPDLRSTV